MMNPNFQYRQHLSFIMKYGAMCAARSLNFMEVIGMQYTVPMCNPVVTIPERKMGFKFAVAEPHWILTGSNLLSDIRDYGKMAPYSDDGYMMRGAYGPKIIDQIPYICRTLAEDIGSRQAVLSIWRERPEKSRDIPCTLSLQFMVRNDFLHCIATMRSSDAIMGLPYDSIMFSLLSAYIISIMKAHYGVNGLSLGMLTLTMGSAHIYDNSFDIANDVINSRYEGDPSELDLNKLAEKTPKVFLDLLDCYKHDEDGSGILDVGKLI